MHSNERREELRAIMKGVVTYITPTGSQYICNPPPDMANSDEDWLVHVWGDVDQQLIEAGFTQLGQPEFYTGREDGGFKSWRRGEVNLIVTRDMEFYKRFESATELAKRLNILEKHNRIALFQVVVYGVEIGAIESEPYRKPQDKKLSEGSEEFQPLFEIHPD